ncbi:gamma-soluble NSF attachment protein-like [Cimex lectularius]|uniref:Gamma-soluble NSF attachment protein n=1 Tax=Cimex lectularius TaxID=79782 RepID=A0A8I6TBP0_CIMLE|nr:gamma-soluble NSF attachment protein-like [Cimex lectularius]
MMGDTKKIEEGLELVKSAEKSLKTTLLKWRPDYEVAAGEFTKAATCFKLGKSYEQCKECHLKAAEAHKQNRSFFYAARSLEQAILVCKDIGDLRDVTQMAERAAHFYQQQGNYDAAAGVLDKACKIIEPTQPEQALRLYQKAADIVTNEDSPRQAAEYVSKTARILVKLHMYDQAADAIRREIGLHQLSENLAAIGRLAVVLVLVQLARGDTVAAEKAFKEWGNCCDAPEVQTLELLLQAFDEEDPDDAKRALNSPFIKHMDVEYSRLARDLPLPKPSIPKGPQAAVRPNAAPSYVSPNATKVQDSKPTEETKDDDDELDLC